MVRMCMLVPCLSYLREREAHAASTIYLLHRFSRWILLQRPGAQLTCITGTEVQILRSYLREAREREGQDKQRVQLHTLVE
jgi:hypothetical protein